MDRLTKRIPYGISNFEIIRTKNYFFLDKTKFIETIENSDSPYLFFLRPRKFGKSLLISMLEYYYDIKQKDKFYEAISIRDFVFHEEGIKTFMLAYLNLSPFFYARSEVEFNQGFADIYLEPILSNVKYRYLIELKYIKSSELKSASRQKVIEQTIERAKAQLQKYSAQAKQPLKLIAVVASSQEYIYVGEVENV